MPDPGIAYLSVRERSGGAGAGILTPGRWVGVDGSWESVEHSFGS